MSDYFSTVRDALGDAAEQRRHRRWYARLKMTPARGLGLLVGVLVVATPAVAAVSGWFRTGRPDATPPVPSNSVFGVVKPGGARLLPIRVADPQGGPAWGLRLVRTDRGNTCLQLGRLKGRGLGSLGIDDAWHNDHQFHAIKPNATYADACGSTDATGHGFLSQDILGESASANPRFDVLRGAQASGCKLRGVGGPNSWPDCPAGVNRMIFLGLLGPDATSITYRRPDGSHGTERTVGGVGAYLLVFTYDQASCHAYSDVAAYHVGCDGIRSGNGVSPDALGAITRITYRDGHSCTVSRTPGKPCPVVGWAGANSRHITAADVAAPIHVRFLPVGTYACPGNPHHLPDGCQYPPTRGNGTKLPTPRVIPLEWSFLARRTVTTSQSWYSWLLTGSGRGVCGGGQTFVTHTRIIAGQTLRYSTFLDARCAGQTYHLVVGYMPHAPAGVTAAGAAFSSGLDGSLLVGRTNLTVPRVGP